jgi:hypothetical protein
MRLANDEPVLLETDERRAHGTARHFECRRDVGLDEAGVGRDLTPDDGLAEGVVGLSDHRATRILPDCREDRQQFCFISARIEAEATARADLTTVTTT